MWFVFKVWFTRTLKTTPLPAKFQVTHLETKADYGDWAFFPHFLIKTIVGFTQRLSFSPRHTSITIEGILVQQISVGCIKMKGAVRVSLTESEKENGGGWVQKEKTNTQGLLNYG